MTVREAAAELGVSQQMIHKLKAQRQLAYVKVGSRIVILDESVADCGAGRSAGQRDRAKRCRCRSQHRDAMPNSP